MRPVKRRKLRGIEVAQAALLLVIGVVVGLVLYFITVGMASSTPAPNVQLDPYNIIIVRYGNTIAAWIGLKFGKSGVITNVTILGEDGKLLFKCYPDYGDKYPLKVKAGEEFNFGCLSSLDYLHTNMVIQVTFADGSVANVRWVTG